MYKTKFKRWKLDKYNRKNETEAILRSSLRRASEGKSSFYRLRGRQMDLSDLIRYAQRKGLFSKHLLGQKSDEWPSDLECLTPTVETPSSLELPEVFRIPERILSSIRGYFAGSFDAGTWVKGVEEDCTSNRHGGDNMLALKALYSNHETACTLLDSGRFEDAGRVLVSASSNLRHILTAEHPRTLGALFDLMIYLKGRRRSEIGIIVLRQMASLASVLFATRHPLRQVLEHLAMVAEAQPQRLIMMAWKCAIDQLEATTGVFSYSTLRSRLEFIQMQGILDGHDNAERMLKNLLVQSVTKCGSDDVRTLKLLESLSELLLTQGKNAEAAGIARQLVALAPDTVPISKSKDLQCTGRYLLGIALYRQGIREEVEENLRQAIELNVGHYGWKHAHTLKYLTQLEDCLTAWRCIDGALKAKEERIKVMDLLDAQL